MLKTLPSYLAIAMVLTTLLTVFLLHFCIKKSVLQERALFISLGILVWMFVQAVLGYQLIFVSTIQDLPPKFPLIIFPSLLFILVLFLTKKGRVFIDSLPLKNLTGISVIRIPVELTLWTLFIYKGIPEIMTFEGLNYDIFAGITAPFIVYFGYVKKQLSKKILLGWNIVSLVLLINIIVISVLSFPTSFQQLGLEQANIAMLYFPYIWLPAIIVPIVLFTHFVSIRILLKH